MKKIKDWIVCNKLAVGLGLISLLILLANFYWQLWPLPAIAIVFIFLVYSFKEQIISITYLAVLSGISPIFATAIVWCFILSYVRYVKDVIKKEKPFYKLQFFYTLVFALVFSLIINPTSVRGVFNLILSNCLLFFVYIIFIYSKEIDVKKCFNALFYAILFSVVFGFGLFYVDTIKEIIYPFDGVYHRLRLFSLNVNQLAMLSMFGLCFVVYDVFNNHINSNFLFLKSKMFWLEICKLALYLVVGLLTMSKAFLVVLAIVAIYSLVMLAVKLKSKSLLIIIPVFVIAGALLLVFKDFASSLISRFFVYSKWETVLSKIFTGRTDIWKEYLKYSSSSVWRMMFGVGFVSADVIEAGPHSIYIYLLYRIGVVGILALGGLLWLYTKKADSKIKLTMLNILPIFVYLVYGLEEMILSDRFFLFLIFAILLTLSPKQNSKKK